MTNKKYVRLNPEKTEMTSAVFNVKPNPIKRHSDEIIHTFNWYVVEQHYVPKSRPSIETHVLANWEVKEDNKVHMYYEPTLIDIAARREALVKDVDVIRDAKLRGGLTFNGHRFDTREITVTRVIGCVLAAGMDENFSTQWVTDDNQTITLNREAMVGLGYAFSAHETGLVIYARSLKDQILASETPEEIDIETGWPSDVHGVVEE